MTSGAFLSTLTFCVLVAACYPVPGLALPVAELLLPAFDDDDADTVSTIEVEDPEPEEPPPAVVAQPVQRAEELPPVPPGPIGPRMEISLHDVEDNPARFLNIFAQRGVPERFNVIRGRAVDAGGVSRQVITLLFAQLLEKEVITLTESQLPCPLPHQRAAQLRSLTQVAQVCSHLNGRLVIGNLFSPLFMQMVHVITQTRFDLERQRRIAGLLRDDPSAGPYARAVLNEGDAVAQLAAVLMESDAEAHIAAQEEIYSYVACAEAFRAGMSEDLELRMLRMTTQEFTVFLQGEPITTEGLLAVLLFAFGTSDNYREWIREKIAHADNTWHARFLCTITGNGTLTPGMSVTIKEHARAGVEVHTCFNSIAFPRGLEKEAFLQVLEASLTGIGFEIG